MDMESLQLRTAFDLMRKTTPILMVRLGAYLVFWVVALVFIVIVGGISWLVAQAVEVLGWILFIAAFAGVAGIYQLAYRYTFFMLKAAHLAVISELLARGSLPAGVNQVAWGKEQVQERFGEINVMFVVDEVVQGVVRTFTRTVYSVARWLPGDSMRQLVQMLNRVIRYATSYIDEAIVARAFWRRDEKVWQSAEEGLVLYAMVWKPLLTNAIALMVLSYLPFVLAVVLFAAPIGFLLSLISSQLAGWSVIAVLVLAYLAKVAIGDTFAMSAMIATYQKETEGMEPDPAMQAQLEQISDEFRTLKERITRATQEAMPNRAVTDH